MADKWFAECLPCKWERRFDVQDDAIAAAEDHVYTAHRGVRPEERRVKFIGHVQNRTEGVVADVSTTLDTPKTPAFVSSPGDGAANLPPAPTEVDAGDATTVEESTNGA